MDLSVYHATLFHAFSSFDVSERIDKFISKKKKGLSFWEVSSHYYFNFLPWINSLLFPLYALITVIFFTSRMAGQTEIIPLFLVPVFRLNDCLNHFIGGFYFTIIHLIGNHYYVPKSK